MTIIVVNVVMEGTLFFVMHTLKYIMQNVLGLLAFRKVIGAVLFVKTKGSNCGRKAQRRVEGCIAYPKRRRIFNGVNGWLKLPETHIGGCVFCKNGDFPKSVFGPKTIMLCDQCEREYHVGCMKEKGVADLQELPEGEWFCCGDCNHIHNLLEGLVSSGPEPVQNQVCGSLLGESQKRVSGEISWQLLHGRRGNLQNGRILSEAASIFTPVNH